MQHTIQLDLVTGVVGQGVCLLSSVVLMLALLSLVLLSLCMGESLPLSLLLPLPSLVLAILLSLVLLSLSLVLLSLSLVQ